MTRAEEAVVRRAAQVLDLQRDPDRGYGYKDHSYRGPTVNEVLVEAVGEPSGDFDHPYWGPAKRALQEAGQRSVRRGGRPTTPKSAPPGLEWGLGHHGVASRV